MNPNGAKYAFTLYIPCTLYIQYNNVFMKC